MKISHKLPLLLTIYSVVLTSVLFAHLWHSENNELERHALREVQLQMSRLQAKLTRALQDNDSLEVQRELSWLSAIPEIYYIFITDDNDWILQGSRFGWGGKLASDIVPQYQQKIAKETRKNNQSTIHFSQNGRSILLYYPLNITEEGKLRRQQTHTIFMLYNLEHKKDELLWRYWQEAQLVFLIAILASLGFMILLYNLISSRVEMLAYVAQQLSAFRYRTRAYLKGNDELAKLGTTFNEMAARLEQAHYDLYQQTRLYNALSETNHAIIHIKDRNALLAHICEIAVNIIGLENAWILFFYETDDDNNLKIISAGDLCQCACYLHLKPQDLMEMDKESTLIGKILYYKQPIILNNFTLELIPLGCYKKSGCKTKSLAIFPLLQENKIIGVLNFCASEINFFIPERLKLVEEIIRDIYYAIDNLIKETRRLEIEKILHNERAFFKKIIDTIPVMIVHYDIEQQMLSVNNKFEQLMGFKPDNNWENIDELRALFERTDEMLWRDYNMLSCYGEVIDTSWALVNLQDDIQVAIGIDLTERKKSERAIKRLAYFDPLTNLPNRRFWNEFVTKQLSAQNDEQNKPLFLLCLDLDRFKIINDTRGHDVGDKLLIHVAERLKTCVYGKNMLARLGGDEFAFLLLDVQEKKTAITVAQKILKVLQTPFIFDKHELKIGGSIGISCSPKDGNQLETLYKYADIAMYYAKQERIGYAFFEEKLAKKLEEDFYLEQALEQAINNNEFYLVYQPRVDLADEKITSVEALLRWKHPERGEISPDVFIILAEQSHIIYDIDDFVLRKACNQIKDWKNKELSLRLAINLSVKAFQRDNLFERIQNILLETGVCGEWLEIEITESAALYDLNLACTTLLKIKELGIHLSIDDFGTGYSSLNYLKSLPVDSLKIDCSLIKDVEKPDSMNHKIVPSILFIAKNLGLKVVAEGVETLEQKLFLKELGCESVQGFYYTKGVLPERLEELAEEFHWLKAPPC